MIEEVDNLSMKMVMNKEIENNQNQAGLNNASNQN